jgi:DNA-binding XRE family transcriptional regulator
MNVRLLKAKRVERGFRQIDVAEKLHITEKTMNLKECSPVNKFTADEMLALVSILSLTAEEFNSIFFDRNLPFWLSIKDQF